MALAADQCHRYLDGVAAETPTSDSLELDESEVWSSLGNDVVSHETPPTQRKVRHRRPVRNNMPISAESLPVNIPDRSEINGGECRPRAAGECEGGRNDRMPPHEYLARSRGASFSVHEGAGRTLKGRDLSRVRNAIWKSTGFED